VRSTARVAERPLRREAQGTRRAENPGALSFGAFSLGEQRKDTRAQWAWKKQLFLKILKALKNKKINTPHSTLSRKGRGENKKRAEARFSNQTTKPITPLVTME